MHVRFGDRPCEKTATAVGRKMRDDCRKQHRLHHFLCKDVSSRIKRRSAAKRRRPCDHFWHGSLNRKGVFDNLKIKNYVTVDSDFSDRSCDCSYLRIWRNCSRCCRNCESVVFHFPGAVYPISYFWTLQKYLIKKAIQNGKGITRFVMPFFGFQPNDQAGGKQVEEYLS